MTDRFNCTSLFTLSWWRHNSAWWYIMNLMAAAGGLYVYLILVRGNVSSGMLAGVSALWMAVVFVCCWFAALAHLRRRRGQAEVNTEKAVSMALLAVLVTLGCLLGNAPAFLTALGFMASALLLAVCLKNAFVGHYQQTSG